MTDEYKGPGQLSTILHLFISQREKNSMFSWGMCVCVCVCVQGSKGIRQ